MPVIRANRTKDYTVMSNYHLRDNRLTLKAKGLLSMILALPDEWHYSISGLAAICIESEDTIARYLQQLQDYGYVIKTQERTSEGRFEYVYTIYEEPYPYLPGTVLPGTVNAGQLNTYKLNTNNIKENSLKESKRKKFQPPTVEEVRAYCKEKGYTFDPELFVAFYESKGWHIGKNKMESWHSACVTWQKKQKAQTKTQTPKKNSFNDFEQHSYDFDSLEDQLFKKMQGRK